MNSCEMFFALFEAFVWGCVGEVKRVFKRFFGFFFSFLVKLSQPHPNF